MPLSRRTGRGEAKGESSGRQSNAIVAAASRLNRASGAYGNMRIPKAGWQAEALRQAEINGELKYATTWMANSLSRCRLVAADVENNKVVAETTNPEVLAIVQGLVGSPGAMAEMLGRTGKLLFLPGDCYVIAEPGPDGNFEKWYTVSINEISAVGQDKVKIDFGNGNPYTLSTETNLIIRVYHQGIDRCWEADSPTRSALPVLREIEEYGRYINAIVSSRLAGAGILGVPSEIDFPAPPEALQPGETNFSATLTKGMVTPISDLSDPSAVVPLVIQAPAEYLEKIVWITDPRGDLTDVPARLRDSALRRLSVALDLPAEVITGQGASNHWGQWALEEQAIKLHIEPLMILICGALTEGFLRPALEAAGIDPDKYTLWFDSTDLVLRPDRGADAKDNYDRGAISEDALRTETGFSELDKPTGEEAALRAVLKVIALAPTTADALLPALVPLLGLDKMGITVEMLQAQAAQPNNGGTPAQDNPPAANPDGRPLPAQPDRQPANAPVRNPSQPGVVASMAIHNALTRAGSMLAGRKAELKDVPKHQVHVALGGISADDANRVLFGQFDYLAEITDGETAEGARIRAYNLLTEGRAL